MKNLLITAAIILLGSPSYAEWFNGGTLHAADMATWKAADPANRLATAGDYSVRILPDETVREIGMDGVKIFATGLVNCIDEVAESEATADQEVAQFAVLCSTLMLNE